MPQNFRSCFGHIILLKFPRLHFLFFQFERRKNVQKMHVTISDNAVRSNNERFSLLWPMRWQWIIYVAGCRLRRELLSNSRGMCGI